MQDGVKRPAKRESSSSSTSSTSSKTSEEPPFKKPKEEKVPEGEKEDEKEDDVDEEEVEKIEEASTEESGEATQPQAAVEPPALGTEEAKESPDTQKTAVSVPSCFPSFSRLPFYLVKPAMNYLLTVLHCFMDA